jgi:ABC-2 type transport system permease protein
MDVTRGQSISALIIFGMGFLGGAFFPVSVLPDWLEPVASIVPPRYAFDGLRAALYEGHGWWGDLLVLLAFSVVMVPVAVWLFERALHHGRRAGSLAQY